MEQHLPRYDVPLEQSGSYKQILEREDVPKDHGRDLKRPKAVRWGTLGVVLLLVIGAVVATVVVLLGKNSSASSSTVQGVVASSPVVVASSSAISTTTTAPITTTTRATTTTTRRVPTPSTSPAVLPATGKFWFGIAVDNSTDVSVQQWTAGGTGVRPLLAHIYFYLQPYNFTTPVQLADYMISFFGGMSDNSVLMFTVQAVNGISEAEAPDSQIQALADAWRELNIRGYKILVRVGHEMNGGWYPWGRIPTLFQEFWIRFTTIVRATAPITSMVWSPTISDSYPYDQRKIPAAGSPDMAFLDTNQNGELDGGDDPYSGYWPGDEWVDWVGGSIYYYGPSFPYNDNFVPDGHWLERTLTGRVTLTGEQRGPSFYDVYCVQKKKPFIYAETAVYHWPNGTGVDEVAQKQAFWRLALNRTTIAQFPMVRALAWFEVAKIEEAWANQFLDFTIGNNPDVLQAFLGDVKAPGNTAANIDTSIFVWG